MKNYMLPLFVLYALVSLGAFAQTISPKSIELVKTDLLQAPQSTCDYFPFLQMDLSTSSKTFLIALCEYDIAWSDPENDQEMLEYTFSDLSMHADDQELRPIGEFTSDQRLSFINNPKYSRVQASERNGSKTLRFGALFIVDKAQSEFTISFAGEETKAKVSATPLPHPSDFAEVEILESKLTDSTKLENSRLKQNIPEVVATLSNPYGTLLLVKTKIVPQSPNVMGGECRYIFRPSDFMLTSEKQILKPLGFLSRDNFGISTIYNLSRKSEDELKTINQELTLVFAVQPDFKSGELIFMNKNKGEVTIN